MIMRTLRWMLLLASMGMVALFGLLMMSFPASSAGVPAYYTTHTPIPQGRLSSGLIDPDGEWIYFWSSGLSTQLTNAGFYRVHADGVGIARLPFYAHAPGGVRISPDGHWLVYSDDYWHYREEVFLVNLTNFEQQNINEKLQVRNENVYSGGFSPDGSLLLAITQTSVWLVKVADGSVQNIVSGVDMIKGAVFSPDQQAIAYIYTTDEGDQIVITDLSGTMISTIAIAGSVYGLPAFTADGEVILFKVGTYGQNDLYRAAVEEGEPELIAQAADIDRVVHLSADDAWLYFERKGADEERDVYRVRPDGSDEQRLTPGTGDHKFVALSPDGIWLIFSTWENGERTLYRMRSDGTDLLALPLPAASDYSIDFAPDQTWMVVSTRYDGFPRTEDDTLYRINLDGTGLQPLVP